MKRFALFSLLALVFLLSACIPRFAGGEAGEALTLSRNADGVAVVQLASSEETGIDRLVTVQVQGSFGLETADAATDALCHPTAGMDNAISCPITPENTPATLNFTGENISAIATWRCSGPFFCSAPGRVR